MVTTQRKPEQLGQILLEQGLISDEHLQRALEEHRNTPKSLGRVLIDLGYTANGISSGRWPSRSVSSSST